MKYIALLFLFSCTQIHSSACIYTPIPENWRTPPQKKLDQGFYECGSKIAKCITNKDSITIIENKANMEEAQRQLVKLIDDMNNHILPEVSCSWLDYECKKLLRKQLPQKDKP